VFKVFGPQASAVARKMGLTVQTVSVKFVAISFIFCDIDDDYSMDIGRNSKKDWL